MTVFPDNVEPDKVTFALLRLPPEVRLDIYRLVFEGTVLHYGTTQLLKVSLTGTFTTTETVYKIPSSKSLALLRVSKQIKTEIGQNWIRYVTFSFEHIRDALDKLALLPDAILSRVRHMRILRRNLLFNTAFSPGPLEQIEPGPYILPLQIPQLRLESLILSVPHPGKSPPGRRETDLFAEILALSAFVKCLVMEVPSFEGCTCKFDEHFKQNMPLGHYHSAAVYVSVHDKPDRTWLVRRTWSSISGYARCNEPHSLESISSNENGRRALIVMKDWRATSAAEATAEPLWAVNYRRWTVNNTWAEMKCFEPVYERLHPTRTKPVDSHMEQNFGELFRFICQASDSSVDHQHNEQTRIP